MKWSRENPRIERPSREPLKWSSETQMGWSKVSNRDEDHETGEKNGSRSNQQNLVPN